MLKSSVHWFHRVPDCKDVETMFISTQYTFCYKEKMHADTNLNKATIYCTSEPLGPSVALNRVFTYPYTPPSQHPEPLHLHPPSPPHIKGHQSPTVQGERQIFREGLSPHKSVVGERERTWYPPYSSKPPPPPPSSQSLSSPMSWRLEEALGGHRNRRGREKEVCGNTSEEDDGD